MKIAILEDEGAAARRLERMIVAQEPRAQIVGRWTSLAQARQQLRATTSPELLFLDIDLGDGSGFEIGSSLPDECAVIFTTAHDEYALRAFELNSVDYLLKPIRSQRLATALERFHQRRVGGLPPALADQLLEQLQPATATRFLVRRGKRLRSLAVDQIAYVYRQELVYLMTHQGERFAIDLALDRVQEKLSPRDFFRIDRRFIAHIEAIRETVVVGKSRLLVHLVPPPPMEPVVSQERAAEFKAWLGS